MGENQRFFSQLLNNLQTLPVYSLKLYSRQTTRWGGGGGRGKGEGRVLSNREGEEKKNRLFGETAVRRGEEERARERRGGMLNT